MLDDQPKDRPARTRFDDYLGDLVLDLFWIGLVLEVGDSVLSGRVVTNGAKEEHDRPCLGCPDLGQQLRRLEGVGSHSHSPFSAFSPHNINCMEQAPRG